jgi:hypothetical protein
MHLVHHSRVKDISDLLFFSGKTVRRHIKWVMLFLSTRKVDHARSSFGGYERVTLLRLILDRPGIIILV